jgi:cytochrome P450
VSVEARPAAGAAPVPPPFSPGYARDPHATHAWLQDEAPLHPEPRSGLLLVSRYADCAALLRHPDTSAAGGQAERQQRGGVPPSLLTTDGADHDALRRPATLLLGQAAVARLLDVVDPALDARLAALAARDTPADLTRDLAEPLATDTMAALLDVPVDAADERDAVDRHARAAAVALNPVPDPRTALRAQTALAQLAGHLAERVAAARGAGAATPLGRLVDDGRLADPQVVSLLSLCVVGGWAPLVDVTTSAVLAALADPAAAAQARTEQGATDLFEEVLRWHGPIPFVARTATADVTVPSGTVPAGTMMLLLVGAADRDPREYPDPHRIVPGRRPRGHLAFGAGPHFCLGAALVRAVGVRVLHRLARDYPGTTAEPAGPPQWLPGVFPRRVASRPVRLRREAS